MKVVNVLLALLTIALLPIYFLQIDTLHSLWTDSDGKLVRMHLGFASARLNTDVKTETIHNYGAYSLIVLALTSLTTLFKKPNS